MAAQRVFLATTFKVFTFESSEQGTSSESLFSALALMKSAHMTDLSNAVCLATRRHRVMPRRVHHRSFWMKDNVGTESSLQNKRSDSALELVPATQPEFVSRQEEEPGLLSALPDNVRAGIYQGAFARNEPVDYIQYLKTLTFEYDLRIEGGVAEFHTWHANLGDYAWSVTSLTLKHWTTRYSFTDSAWQSSEDQTIFSRGPQGERTITRAVATPARETCNCSLPYLLAQHDQVFDPETFRSIRNMTHFINCLRADENVKRPTLVGAAATFAAMLDERS